MKLYFENAQGLDDGIALLLEDLDVTLAPDAEVTVTVCELERDQLCISLASDKATISYGGGRARFFRGLATLVGWLKEGVCERTVTETPLFCSNGAMVDMSRNAVMNVPTVKMMLRKMALMGMNTFMLYTEDTYEIEGRPYFGYMRGRYTPAEIKELDAYALKLGIELVPCIQTLGHLESALRWSVTAPYKDTADVLMVDAEETYRLIDDMLRTVAACFTSRRLHIGMDETHSLGTGKYLDKNGYRPREELYLRHLNKVSEMAIGYGFKPMMWSDMFFRMSGGQLQGYKDYDKRTVLRSDIAELVPRGVQQVFWDYYNPDEEFYSMNIDKHRQLGENIMFAGGVWTWSGHCPLFSRSLRHTIPALDACRKKGIREVLATVWHNGAESCLVLSLAGLAWYADYDYTGGYDEESVKRCFRYAVGERYDDFLKTELPEHPHGADMCITRSLVYNDPLLGLMDKHLEGIDMQAYYKKVIAELAGLGSAGIFAPAFETVRALADLLYNKADFGVRLKKAYDADDREALAAMAEECDTVVAKLRTLRDVHRAAWMKYCKPFGWEIFDIRYGGQQLRFETAKARILAYLAGEIDAIEELAEERLRFDCAPEGTEPVTGKFLWHTYTKTSGTAAFR
ncbi:MAG: beta-N-acetylhexosaminidase [Ruminococcaceae bacterium]|nr:beta-N-acetylhexosaminidase [Oscillospiraceae bacterium]